MDCIPARDTKGTVHSDRYQIGGPVPTALALLRRLGHECAFIGRWANDPMGAMIEADLDHEGIERTHSIVTPDARSGFAHVWVDRETGDRSVAAFRGSTVVEPDELPDDQGAFQILHLDGWHTEAAITLARQMKIGSGFVSLDLGSPKPHLEQLLEFVNFVNVPARCLAELCPERSMEDGAREILRLGPDRITVTDGANGAHLFTKAGAATHQPAFQIEAVDTNGAGDVFSGAMIHALAMKLSDVDALAFAAAASAIKCTRMGNRKALPGLDEIRAFLEKHGQKMSAPPNKQTV